MLDIARQTINYYTKYFKTPTVNEITITDNSLIDKQWSIFVTIYKNWEVRWSAWNIKEIKSSIINEIIENTIEAISKDSRFEPLKLDETHTVKLRIDIIKNRTVLQNSEINKLDPVKFWVLAIKKDYEKMACILPNISPLLLSWEDFIPVLKAKFNEKKFDENDYILYSIETEIIRD